MERIERIERIHGKNPIRLGVEATRTIYPICTAALARRYGHKTDGNPATGETRESRQPSAWSAERGDTRDTRVDG